MIPDVDLVISFRASKKSSLSKQQIRDDARKAEQQYSRLIDTLTYGGLRAVGRRGESLGHLLVLVSCPQEHIENLVKRERESDFLSGLSTKPVESREFVGPLSSADRLRRVYAYVTSSPADGGLGITQDVPEWDLVESIMILHDRQFNDAWLHAWSIHHIADVQLDKIRDQFGDSIALYYAFLSSYTKFLAFPAVSGLLFYFFGSAYSPTYSILIFLWSVIFVEWWRVRERILSLRFGTRGSLRVEKRRVQYKPGFPWWKRELRMIASLPVLTFFAFLLAALLTGIFVFEAFVTQLYTGPGHQLIALSPTLLFVALVPQFMAMYQSLAQHLTTWENHSHQSAHQASLTIKTFALSSQVAYLGLALSAFVYVPFGEGVMQLVQTWLFNGTARVPLSQLQGNTSVNATVVANTSSVEGEKTSLGSRQGMWDVNTANARHKLDPRRLRNQMFAFMVTSQVINAFQEIGLPYVLRAVASFRNGRKKGSRPGSPASPSEKAGATVKKRVVFEDEKEKGGMEEREFLDRVREEVARPEYDLFEDYNEMVTQFGYVAVWSTIWPLASVMAVLNNFLELRSDALKMTAHHRRPIPTRTDTIGPWLDALTFLTWLSALTNSALVYLFCPRSQVHCSASANSNGAAQLEKVHQHLFAASGATGAPGADDLGLADGAYGATRELLMTALLIALAASHGYILVRAVVRHIMERAVWSSSREVKEQEVEERKIKETFLQRRLSEEKERRAHSRVATATERTSATSETGEEIGFWDNDEGLEEIKRITKEV